MIKLIKNLFKSKLKIATTDCEKNKSGKDMIRGFKDDTIRSYKNYRGKRKRFIRSLEKNKVELPSLHRNLRHRWVTKKEFIEKFIDDLDYNNQIQPTYDLTLIERQNKRYQQDVA
tara:strand:- start:61 stop:405 length:345 start_codon:yes stop_codon:yes gene_type:complete